MPLEWQSIEFRQRFNLEEWNEASEFYSWRESETQVRAEEDDTWNTSGQWIPRIRTQDSIQDIAIEENRYKLTNDTEEMMPIGSESDNQPDPSTLPSNPRKRNRTQVKAHKTNASRLSESHRSSKRPRPESQPQTSSETGHGLAVLLT